MGIKHLGPSTLICRTEEACCTKRLYKLKAVQLLLFQIEHQTVHPGRAK